jgi:hypothetical protein
MKISLVHTNGKKECTLLLAFSINHTSFNKNAVSFYIRL